MVFIGARFVHVANLLTAATIALTMKRTGLAAVASESKCEIAAR